MRTTAHRLVGGDFGRTRSLLLVDAGVAVFFCGALLFANSRPMLSTDSDLVMGLRIGFTVVAAATVGVRRVQPRWCFVLATVGVAVVTALGGAPQVSICLAVTAYSAAVTGDYTPSWAPPAAVTTIVGATVAIGRVSSWLAGLIATVALVCVGWFAGQAARERHNRLAAVVEQQVERQRQHAAELRQAAVDERLVIARELHDIVAHAMSVIAVRAGVARLVMDDDPAEVKETLAIIETTTRQALHEMRLLVAVLRHEDGIDAALAPAPGLADITTLAEQIRRAGVDLELQIEGAPRPLPPGVDLSAYRIAQEALTNVVRHAGPTRATLRIEYRAEDLVIDVSDAGPAGAGARTNPEHRTNAGHGLIGMTERVALFDGHLQTGVDGAGFKVHAQLRTDESAS